MKRTLMIQNFLALLLACGMVLSGCIVLVPVPVPAPAPAPVQGTPAETTPGAGPSPLLQVEVPTTEQVILSETGTLTPVPVIPTGTGTPVPTPIFYRNPLPLGGAYTYGDNMDFHSVSVSVENYQVRTRFYYTPAGYRATLTPVDTMPGLKFLMVGVDFRMTGLRQEGKSSSFMTPLATSFQLLKDTESYQVLNASDITGMTDYYIRDIGSMYHDRLITKEDNGGGVLIFVVNQSFDPREAYITFCPRNLDSWSGYYRSPDNWDCERNLVVWKLR